MKDPVTPIEPVEQCIYEVNDIIALLIKGDKWKGLANRMSKLLVQKWNDEQKDAIREAIRFLSQGDEAISKEEFSLAIDDLQNKLGSRIAEVFRGDVEKIQLESYSKGHTDAGIDFEFNSPDKRALSWLFEKDVKQFWIGESYSPELNEDLQRIASQVIKSGLGRSDAARLFKKSLGDQFQKTNNYWELMANHIVTRAREFGRISAYEKAGVEYVRIQAIIDGRTSSICLELNGRVIEISRLVDQRNKLMNASSKDEVKKIAPWYTKQQIKSKVQDKQTKKLPKGIGNPPYHAHCRTTTVIWTETDNIIERYEYGKSIKDKKLLDSYSPEEYSNIIKDIKGRAAGKGLSYSEYDLANDKKHQKAFGLTQKEFLEKANQIVKESSTILAQTYAAYDKTEKKYLPKEIQVLYFGKDGYVVVNKNFEIKGCFPHLKSGGITKVLEIYKENRLWITTKEQN